MSVRIQRGELGIRIATVEKRSEIDRLIELVAASDVWRSLWTEPPTRTQLNGLTRLRGLWSARFIRMLADDRIIGFQMLFPAKAIGSGVVECAIAITDPTARGQGVALRASALVFDELLLGGQTPVVWAWVAVDNEKSLKLMKELGVREVDNPRPEYVPGTTDPVRLFEVDVPLWRTMRALLARDIGLPAID